LHDRCNWSPLRIRGGDIPGVVKALFLTALRNPVLVLLMAGSSLTTIYKSKIPHAQHLQGFLSFCTAVYVFYLLTVWQRMVQAETRAS
jgi:high-affinity K+ transport system ATPase subunit B